METEGWEWLWRVGVPEQAPSPDTVLSAGLRILRYTSRPPAPGIAAQTNTPPGKLKNGKQRDFQCSRGGRQERTHT